MYLWFKIYIFLFLPVFAEVQEQYVIEGVVMDEESKQGVINGAVFIEGTSVYSGIGTDGTFRIKVGRSGDFILNISSPDHTAKRMPLTLENTTLDLGVVYLEKSIVLEQSDNLISLTDMELEDDEGTSFSAGPLQATRDVFLNKAAFDFGQAFFRVRGYDAQYGDLLINGIPMNSLVDGRPQWNHWGGLNDVTRNQQFTHGANASEFTFGGILGNTNINMRPTMFRSGFRWSSAASNRTYAGRLMSTYSHALQKNGFAFSVSASRRWAKQGYIQGTLYDAYSFYGGLEYQINTKNALLFTGIFASNRRGRSSAITEEVFELVGNRYNPYWGEQDGKIRNSRERKIAAPILMFNYFYTSRCLNLNTGISYQFGINARSSLGYYNAPNPDPTYYRYLPSFQINSPIGANFTNANLVREAFLRDPQFNWGDLYTSNSEKASYATHSDLAEERQFTLNLLGNYTANTVFRFDFGTSYKQLRSHRYAKLEDLLGSEVHLDVDPFSNTLNAIGLPAERREGDIFNYNYIINATRLNAFAQLSFSLKKWDGFVAGNYVNSTYQRDGQFQNERFVDYSLGKSEPIDFIDYGLKAGIGYAFTGRHRITSHAVYLTQAPNAQNVFVNPRENNLVVPKIKSELISTLDLNYLGRLPRLTARISGYYSRFQHTTDINFFFVDAGVGSDFVQEVVTDLDKLHMGIELGVEYELSATVKLSGAIAWGKYVYASDPNIAIYFDTAGKEEDLIDKEGTMNLDHAAIKGYKLAQGPQKAFAFGVHYRDPKYWWVGATANFLQDNYINIATITRTQSFWLNPETGSRFQNATEENVSRMLGQKPFENTYLLNLVGGKSWLKKGTYISLFASINNLFNVVYKTGGYEQARNGNFGQMWQDQLSGNPSFAPKYWYGYGRTYFLNLAYSF
tara:strand:+ start:972 stop:3698 length:2727 start_codon:yes stop_codon:yes gene_type:complete